MAKGNLCTPASCCNIVSNRHVRGGQREKTHHTSQHRERRQRGLPHSALAARHSMHAHARLGYLRGLQEGIRRRKDEQTHAPLFSAGKTPNRVRGAPSRTFPASLSPLSLSDGSYSEPESSDASLSLGSSKWSSRGSRDGTIPFAVNPSLRRTLAAWSRRRTLDDETM